MRYAIDLCYLGTKYHGWQIQPNSVTVQETLEHALSLVLRQNISVTASGRTDAGVHASQQIIHFDSIHQVTNKEISKVNRVLPIDISILHFAEVADDFHARFDATERAYVYHIHQHKNPYVIGQSYFFPKTLDINIMNQACSYLVGNQDFESFSKVKTVVNTFECHIKSAYFSVEGSRIEFHVTANRFLRGMVRALVGTLLEVGLGNKPPVWIKEIIVQKDRCKAGRNVLPDGLFLCSVKYGNDIDWQKIS